MREKREAKMEEKHPFLLNYDRSELKIAAEFLTTWLPFLTNGLCRRCSRTLSNRVSSLDPDTLDLSTGTQPLALKEIQCDCQSDTNSLGSWKESALECSTIDSLYPGSWEDSAFGCSGNDCTNSVSSPDPGFSGEAQPLAFKEIRCYQHSDTNLLGGWKDDAVGCSARTLTNRVYALNPDFSGESTPLALKESDCDCHSDANSLGSWKDSATECSPYVPDANISVVDSPSSQVSSADMEDDDALDEDEDEDDDIRDKEARQQLLSADPTSRLRKKNSPLSREQREYRRFQLVKRKKDFIFWERIRGININILDGLELHTGVFSVAEQNRIVDFIYSLEEKGRKGELKERTFSAPEKWMPGKGRVTIQFGCCYNYAVLKDGTPPGILKTKEVDPLPELFKAMIRRLIQWHVLPPTCVPDSCIVNIYEQGDCIPPHIDHHDFLRPFCTVSFLSKCDIVFGSNLKIIGPGEFSGDIAIPLPLGSVLVIDKNGANVAKHCVPAVPKKRISITFRKMDIMKRPVWFVPEDDLKKIEPLPYKVDETNRAPVQIKRQPVFSQTVRRFSDRGTRSEPRLKPGSNWKGILPVPPGDELKTRSPENGSLDMKRRPIREKERLYSERGSRSEPHYYDRNRSQGV